MKKVSKFLVSLLIITIFALIAINISYATDPADLNFFKPDSSTDAYDSATATLDATLSVIQVIGIGIAVVMLTVLGIKYMISSSSDKAEIKKHAVVYVVGAILLFAASGIVQIVKEFSKNFN